MTNQELVEYLSKFIGKEITIYSDISEIPGCERGDEYRTWGGAGLLRAVTPVQKATGEGYSWVDITQGGGWIVTSKNLKVTEVGASLTSKEELHGKSF